MILCVCAILILDMVPKQTAAAHKHVRTSIHPTAVVLLAVNKQLIAPNNVSVILLTSNLVVMAAHVPKKTMFPAVADLMLLAYATPVKSLSLVQTIASNAWTHQPRPVQMSQTVTVSTAALPASVDQLTQDARMQIMITMVNASVRTAMASRAMAVASVTPE